MKKQITNYQDKWKGFTVKIEGLLLDPENIRLEIEQKTQGEIISDLFVNEKAMQILENIYENGFFPDESPVVVREKDGLIVLEGNRRVASLQAMLDPKIVPAIYEQKIKKMMLNVLPITDIEVRIAGSREEAMQYLAAKHTKTTLRPWTALRRAYFYYAQKEKGQSTKQLVERYKGTDIPKYIRMYEMHLAAVSLKSISEEVLKKVSNKRNFDITTLERLYQDKYVQEKLGILFDNKTGEVLIPTGKDFDTAYSRIITDVIDKIVTSRKRLGDIKSRRRYIDEVIPKRIISKDKVAVKDLIPKEITAKTKNKLDISGIKFLLPYPAVERMFNEIKRISISNGVGFPNAAHDLLRSFLECSLKAFFESQKISVKKRGKYTYLKDALDTFGQNEDVKKIAGNKYTALNNLVAKIKQEKGANSMMGYTANFMNQLNHSHYFFSDRETVQKGWDELKPLFMFVLSATPKDEE